MNKKEKLEVFNDGYLKNLCYETIAELAKKPKKPRKMEIPAYRAPFLKLPALLKK